MNDSEARFEFRAWEKNFGVVETRMRRYSRCESISESEEVYIITSGNNDTNTKIRDEEIDIKVLIQEREGLEQWRPHMKTKFPMGVKVLASDVFSKLRVERPVFDRNEYSQELFLDEIIRPHPELMLVNVFKRRFAFTINNCIAELVEVWINGAGVQTVAIESTDASAVLNAIQMLRLDDYDNVNYLRAIKKIIGMGPL